jgi:DNA-binding transcriptional ArsR family regulator
MGEPFERISGLDRTIHDPSRLALMTALRSTTGADFLYLRRLTGMSKGNMSNHLAKLEEAGLVSIGKRFVGKKPVTSAALTAEGRAAVEAHWSELKRLDEEAERWRREQDNPRAGGLADDPLGGGDGRVRPP